jgi:hypothetical protein
MQNAELQTDISPHDCSAFGTPTVLYLTMPSFLAIEIIRSTTRQE